MNTISGTTVLHKPLRLQSPFSIGVLSPSGFVRDVSVFEKAIENLITAGFPVKVSANARGSFTYFSATDQNRVQDITTFSADSTLQVIMASRGGYGLSRILPKLPWQQMAESGQSWVGFSDFTLIHLGLLAHRAVSFAGPMVAVDLSDDLKTSASWKFLNRLLTEDVVHTPDIDSAHPYSSQVIDGIIWGGCLSIIQSAVGTSWFPDVDDGILFIEDVNEEPYKIERMILHLHQAGILSRQKAILFGSFTNCEPGPGSAWPYTMDHVVSYTRTLVDCPVLTGFPFGHTSEKLAVPIGAQTQLTISKNRYKLRYSDFHQ